MMAAIGLDAVEFDPYTAEPVVDQFWTQFDINFDLTEAGMHENLDVLITDPGNQAAVEALMQSRSADAPKLE